MFCRVCTITPPDNLTTSDGERENNCRYDDDRNSHYWALCKKKLTNDSADLGAEPPSWSETRQITLGLSGPGWPDVLFDH